MWSPPDTPVGGPGGRGPVGTLVLAALALTNLVCSPSPLLLEEKPNQPTGWGGAGGGVHLGGNFGAERKCAGARVLALAM